MDLMDSVSLKKKKKLVSCATKCVLGSDILVQSNGFLGEENSTMINLIPNVENPSRVDETYIML